MTTLYKVPGSSALLTVDGKLANDPDCCCVTGSTGTSGISSGCLAYTRWSPSFWHATINGTANGGGTNFFPACTQCALAYDGTWFLNHPGEALCGADEFDDDGLRGFINTVCCSSVEAVRRGTLYIAAGIYRNWDPWFTTTTIPQDLATNVLHYDVYWGITITIHCPDFGNPFPGDANSYTAYYRSAGISYISASDSYPITGTFTMNKLDPTGAVHFAVSDVAYDVCILPATIQLSVGGTFNH